MRKPILWFPRLLWVCLSLHSLGCDVIYGLLDREGAQEKKLIGTALPFEKNEKVAEIQALLKIYGYYPGFPDGVLGTKTRLAITRFQEENDLKVSHYVDEATWAKLNVFRINGLIEETQLNIKLIQRILKARGFSPGVADGRGGPKTTEAIRQFQKAHGLVADGKIGYKTLLKLSSYLLD